MKIVLHIGTEKTATTSIQKNLYENRRTFTKMKVLYPDRLGGENHLCLPACAAGRPDFDEITANAYGLMSRNGYDDMDKYVVETLDKQIKYAKPELILFSNEHLHSRVKSTEGVKRLKSVLSNITEDIKIVVYIRRQDRLAVSFFSTPFKYGKETVGNAIPTVSGALPHYYDYGNLVARWSEVFGRENVIVKVFEDEVRVPGGIFRSFLNAAGVASPPVLKLRTYNESLSLEAVHFLASFNEKMAAFPEQTAELRKMRASLVRFLEKNYPARQKPASRDMARRFYEACRPSNDIVLRGFFPGRNRLFDESFDEYKSDENPVPDGRILAEIGANVAFLQMTAALKRARGRVKEPQLMTA